MVTPGDVQGLAGLIVSVLLLFCRAMVLTLEVFLRTGFGVRFITVPFVGMGAVAVGIWLAIWSTSAPDTAALSAFLRAYLVLAAWAWIRGVYGRFSEEPTDHSQYSGYPLLCVIFPALDESTVKRFFEPALVFSVGWCVRPHSTALGNYLEVGGVLMFAFQMFITWRRHQQHLDLHDAIVESQDRAGR